MIFTKHYFLKKNQTRVSHGTIAPCPPPFAIGCFCDLNGYWLLVIVFLFCHTILLLLIHLFLGQFPAKLSPFLRPMRSSASSAWICKGNGGRIKRGE